MTGSRSVLGTVPASHRLLDIEALRGIAVAMVYLQHLPILLPSTSALFVFETRYWHGAAGVDLFFCISGFVIARSLLPNLDACADATSAVETTLTFLLRRFWRLTPSAWLWIAVVIVLSATFNVTGVFGSVYDDTASGLAAAFSGYNLWFAGLPDQTLSGCLSGYWSLSFEEQFYLALPIAALVLRRRLVWLLAMLLLYQLLFIQPTLLAAVTRPGGIAVGVLLALWSVRRSYAQAKPVFLARNGLIRTTFLILVIFLLGSLASPFLAPLYSVPQGLVALVAGVLVYAASFDSGFIAGRGAVRHVLCWLGSRSYAIYLIHLPVFALVREVGYRAVIHGYAWNNHSSGLMVGVSGVVVLCLAELNYRFVEAPGRSRGRKIDVRLPSQHAGTASFG